eukprot:Partr_v1_DN27354_c0_g1_i3_m46562 putative replication factor c
MDLSGKGKAKENDSPAESLSSFESLPWVEKYRPQSLDDLISHQDILATISKFMDQNRLPHLLFYGPPGTGKTSTILACAKKLYGSSYRGMILEVRISLFIHCRLLMTHVVECIRLAWY